jgi:hypothetical protein
MRILLPHILEDGTVFGLKGKPLKHRIDKGYVKVRLPEGWYPLHRLLALKFIPNPEGKAQVNHKDGNKLNNSLDNLEWVTHQENLYHAMDNGLHHWGRTKIKSSDGIIYSSQAEAARALSTHQGNIARALRTKGKCAGRTWEYV